MSALFEPAKSYRDSELSPIPVCGKRPMIRGWASRKGLPVDQEIGSWADLRTEDGAAMDGLGLVCGKASKGLICIDIDVKNDPTDTMAKEFFDLVKEMGGTAIVDSCIGQKTPSGGFHLVFRCEEIKDGNQVLARSDETGKPVIETRGEGGQFVVYPSPGYSLFNGRLEDVKNITLRDAETLFAAARAIDRTTPVNYVEAAPPTSFKAAGELTPLDDFNARATVEDMQAEIEAAGFVRVRQRGENIHYRRPGKTGRDTSATLHVQKKRFYIFSSSTQFEAGKAYSPAALHCVLHNHGNWSETARALRKAGFGGQRSNPAALASTKQPPILESSPDLVVSAEVLLNQLVDLYRRPYDPGVSLGWPQFDKLLRLKRGRLIVVTGIPGSGKSTWLNQVFIHLADAEGWRIAIYSPECASPDEHLSDMVEILLGRPFYGKQRPSEAEVIEAAKKILQRITFIKQPLEGVTFDQVLQAAESIRPDALLIDPWNRLMHSRPDGQTETEYIGACLSKAAAFSKAHNLSFWIVAHPQKIRRDKDHNLLRPGLYDVSGSANWANMIDVGILVWRNYARGSNEIEIIKVRHKRDGEPGLVEMKLDKETGRFRPWENADDFLPALSSKPAKAVASSLPVGDSLDSVSEDWGGA
jgi:hypothetical protein